MKLRKDKWEFVPIGKICETTSGGTPLRSNYDYYGGNIPWIKSGELHNKYVYSSEETLTEKGLKNSSAKLFPPNTVLVAIYGVTSGTSAILKVEAATNQAVCGIFPNNNLISEEYLYSVLNFKKDEIFKRRVGTYQLNVSQAIIRETKIPLPPLEEQKQIAALFQSIETAMEQVDGQEKNLKALRKSLINKLTKQKPEFGNLLTKANCKEYSIGDLAVEVPDRTDNPQKSGIDRFIGLEDFESGELTIQKYSSTEKLVSAMKLCKKGDVLFARRNAYLKRASLTNFDAVCSGDVIVMRANEKNILPKFLILIMNTDEFWEFAISNAAGTMSKRVKWRDLATYTFELPELKVQEKILKVFNQLEETLSQLKQQKATLRLLKQKLLNEILG